MKVNRQNKEWGRRCSKPLTTTETKTNRLLQNWRNIIYPLNIKFTWICIILCICMYSTLFYIAISFSYVLFVWCLSLSLIKAYDFVFDIVKLEENAKRGRWKLCGLDRTLARFGHMVCCSSRSIEHDCQSMEALLASMSFQTLPLRCCNTYTYWSCSLRFTC